MYQNRIFFIGDIHGQFQWIQSFAARLAASGQTPLDESDWIVLLGDSGLNYWTEPKRAKSFKTKFTKLPCNFFVIRGNHEERAENVAKMYPEKWGCQLIPIKNAIQGMAWREYDYPNIYYALDQPYLYNIKGYSAFVIPGAYSADKPYRIANGLEWFASEQLSDAEQAMGRQIAYANRHFDFILSHTCPSEYEPTDLYLPTINQSTVDKTMEWYLNDINHIAKSNFHLFGHFHAFRVYPIHPGDGQKIMMFNDRVLEMDNILKGNYWETI